MQPVNTSNSDAANLNQMNDLNRQVQNMQEVQVFKDDTGTRRVLLGKGNNGFYGVKVSQAGNDVYTAVDDELVMSSDFNMFKIVGTGTGSLPALNVAAGNFDQTDTDFAIGATVPDNAICVVWASIDGSVYYPLDGAVFHTLSTSVGGINPTKMSRFNFTVLGNFLNVVRTFYNGTGSAADAPTVDIKFWVMAETAT